MNPKQGRLLSMVRNRWRFRLFLFARLPIALISGVRIEFIDENLCRTSIKYGWLTRNPFRSTYFASLSMAAEMSTGALSMVQIDRMGLSFSMLVLKTEGTYSRRGLGKTVFECNEGGLIRSALERAMKENAPQEITLNSVGRNEVSEIVAEFRITWSFKARANKG